MNIRPLYDRVLVKRMDEETTSAGGIVLPGSAAEKPMRGEIVSAGKGKRLESGEIVPLDVKIGDTVLFGKYSGTEVKELGDDMLVMREEDIMGVIEA
jgi:chaperonin GroES